MTTINLKYHVLFLFLIFCNNKFAETDNFIDSVPRDRLVSDEELFKLLDAETSELSKVEGVFNLEKLAKYFCERNSPKYFFNSKNVLNDLDDYLIKFPDEQNRIKKKVDEFQISYGNNIDWLLPGVDLHNRALTPNSIRYNARFPMAYEYSLNALITKNKTDVLNLLDQLKDFMRDYENGETESKENDVFERFYAGHRTRNLLFAHNLLLANPNYNWNDQIYMLKVFLLHGAKLIDVCKEFNWGNHQLHGLAGLYEMTLMYPEFPIMQYWNNLALKTIMEHIEKEILSDGFQFERASHYFKLDIMNYFRVYKIATTNDIILPELYVERFHKMFDALLNLAMPNKRLPVLQDAQGIYDPQNGTLDNNDAAELSDPNEDLYMTIGAAVFHDPFYKFLGDESVPADLYWFFNNEEKNNYEKLTSSMPSIRSVALPESKYYVMRTGWDENSYYLLIDGGLAKNKPDHTHGGILGITANLFGQSVLPTYRVKYSEPSYRYLKNSYAKNVALANNIVQGKNWKSNNARTGFGSWLNLPEPVVNDWISGDNYDYFSGNHNGFIGDGITYNRTIIFFKPNFWLVIDNYFSKETNSYQQLWQGDYDLLDDCNGVLKTNGETELFIIQADYADMSIEPYSKFGYNSVKFEKQGLNNYAFMTILYPNLKSDIDKPEIREFERNDYKQIVISKGNLKSCFYLNKGEVLNLDEIKSDAKFVCSTYENNELKDFFVYDGTFCELEGEKVTLNEKSKFEAKFNEKHKLTYKLF